jgi:hypothetical protein
MAALPEGQEAVAAAIAAMNATNNTRVHDDLLSAIAELPSDTIAALLPQVMAIVEEPYGAWLSPRIAPVVVGLAEGGHADEAAQVVRVSLALSATEPVEVEGDAGGKFAFPRGLRGRYNDWAYDQLASAARLALAAAAPRLALEAFTGILADGLQAARPEASDPYDGSTVWRPSIARRESYRKHDVEDVLVDAVRDTALELASEGQARALETVEHLEDQRWDVFRRIALHVLNETTSLDIEPIASRLLDRSNFDDTAVRREYRTLLASTCRRLSESARETVLGWIEAGPDIEEAERDSMAFHGRPSTEAERHRRIARWQRGWLAPIADTLEGRHAHRYAEIVSELGEPSTGCPSGASTTYVGPTSPLDREALKSMSAMEIREFVLSWSPSDDWNGPTPEGLGRLLKSVVEESPERFAEAAVDFGDLGPTVVRALFGGLTEAVKAGHCFPWPAVFTLAGIAIGHRDDPRREAQHLEGRDPHWGWAIGEVSRLLRAAFQRGTCELPHDLAEDAWNTLVPITLDPDPTPEHESEYGGDNMDPPTLALNTVRGAAMGTVVHYGLWVRRHHEAIDDDVSISKGFDAIPGIRDVLNTHLDTDHEPSAAVRSAYGQWFPWLLLLDSTWATDQAPRIFDVSSEPFWSATWDTYVRFCQPYNDAFEVLRPAYTHAAAQMAVRPQFDNSASRRLLMGERRHTEAEASLAEHIMVFFWRGLLTLEEEPLVSFYRYAPVSIRAHALEFIGRTLSNTPEPTPEVVERLKQLWGSRLDAADETDEELASFGWWFSSDRLPQEWGLEQLSTVLERVGHIEGEPEVAKSLARLATDRPAEVMALFRELVRVSSRDWSVDFWAPHLLKAIRDAQSTASVEARAEADALIHELGREGHFEFQGLLGGEG